MKWNPLNNLIKQYFLWLHGKWPAGIVEPLPEAKPNGSTLLPGVWIAGELLGIPLLKYAANSGKKIAQEVKDYLQSSSKYDSTYLPNQPLDLCILGGGVSGLSCALEAENLELQYKIIESKKPFFTIHDFPNGKPIYLYPENIPTDTSLNLKGTTKEILLENLNSTKNLKEKIYKNIISSTVSHIKKLNGIYSVVGIDGNEILQAKTICIAMGRSGEYNQLNIPGAQLPKVFYKLHDPFEFKSKNVIVVGGGDSALETAILLSEAGANVSLSYRKDEITRAKLENINKFFEFVNQKKIHYYPSSTLLEIRENSVQLETQEKKTLAVANDFVFAMIGRKPPLDFFRKSGIPIQGEWKLKKILSLIFFIFFCIWLYHWKLDGSFVYELFRAKGWFPFQWEALRAEFHPRQGFLYIIATNLVSPSFYYSFLYTALVGIFGILRVRRNPTPYIKLQTLTLFLIQFIPLFFLPYFLLPWLGSLGWYDTGLGAWFADTFFPRVDYGLGREYWRAFGFILAWPLFIWNVFSGAPLWGWLVLSFIQTFVIVPIIVWKWGKGAYCGWICSCGALAETLGDAHRKKMPHGPLWNKLNMLGQVILLFAIFLLLLRIASWLLPGWIAHPIQNLFFSLLYGWNPFTYYYLVDVWLAGILGVGLYFHFSGRTWCRFACPLAALMHIYARFSRFRIFSDKKKCISCNICTSVCHQGIDVMAFANKGLPMEDPQCVRCSACVVNCPTEVLSFGYLDKKGYPKYDKLQAKKLEKFIDRMNQ